MPVTLVAINNNDGTVSVVASGLNAVAPTAVALYYYRLSTYGANPTPALFATITYPAGGAIDLVDKGLYSFFGSDSDGNFTNVAAVFVTNGEALATRCGEAVAAEIAALALVDDSTATPTPLTVYRQWNDDLTNVTFPCCIVDVNDQIETDSPAVSTIDDIGYPANVLILDANPLTDHSKLPMYELWRQTIARTFRRQRLFGVPESKINQVEFGNIGDHVGQAYDKLVSKLTIRCICREPRGIGV